MRPRSVGSRFGYLGVSAALLASPVVFAGERAGEEPSQPPARSRAGVDPAAGAAIVALLAGAGLAIMERRRRKGEGEGAIR